MNDTQDRGSSDWINRFSEEKESKISSASGSDADTPGATRCDQNDRPSSPSPEESAKAALDADCSSCGGAPCMPKPTFSTFALSLASSALVQLGEVPDPDTGKHNENIALAKHTIDVLAMLQDKIANGLDAEETRLLEGLLYELRMKFVMKQ